MIAHIFYKRDHRPDAALGEAGQLLKRPGEVSDGEAAHATSDGELVVIPRDRPPGGQQQAVLIEWPGCEASAL